MRASLLIIADKPTSGMLSTLAQPVSWTVQTVELGSGSLTAVIRAMPAVVIIDAREGSSSLVEICRTIRSIEGTGRASLVALAGSAESYRVKLTEAGVDICWSDPVDPLEARMDLEQIHRQLHRTEATRVVCRAGVVLDLDCYTARASGPRVQLTALQVGVLDYLMKRAGKAVSVGDLSADVWGNLEVDERAIRKCIERIRKLLARTGAPDAIQSAPGRAGYFFKASNPPVIDGPQRAP